MARQRVKFLSPVTGGINLRAGQVALSANQTRSMRNWDLDNQGGLVKIPGLTFVLRLPSVIHDCFLYKTAYQGYEVFAYHGSTISKLDLVGGAYSVSKTLSREGDPVTCQYLDKLHLVDGKNDPIIYNGSAWTTVPWPPAYTAINKDQLESVYARSTNPATASKPKGCAIHANRAWYINDEIGRAFASIAGDTSNFYENSGTPVPIDVAFFVDFPVTTPFTAIRPISDGLVFYEETGISRLTGENAPIAGLSNQFEFKKINTKIGAVSQKMTEELGTNDHYFYSKNGLFQLSISDNFEQLKPAGLSYLIQPDFDDIGSQGMARGRMFNSINESRLYMDIPRKRTHRYRDKTYKLNVGVSEAVKKKGADIPWSVSEFLGTDLEINARFITPQNNQMYVAIHDCIYRVDGYGGYNSASIQSHYEYAPEAFDASGLVKQISAYYLLITSATGGTFYIDHSWDNKAGGRTPIAFPATSGLQLNLDTISSTTVNTDASFLSSALRVPVDGGQVGKNLIIKVLHNSNVEDLTIHGIGIEYNLWGIGG